MKPWLMTCLRAALFTAVPTFVTVVDATSVAAQNAYITNTNDNTVSVIDTTTDTVIGSPIPVGNAPSGITVAPDGRTVYVANDGAVSVIDTTTNTVVATISVANPEGIAVTPDGSKVYVASGDNTVSMITTANNTVTATIPNISTPFGLAVTPDGSKIYVSNEGPGTVTVIDAATNTVIGSPISVGGFRSFPEIVAVAPDGGRVYVTKVGFGNMSVIDTAINGVVDTVRLAGFGTSPFGVAVTPDGSRVYVAVTSSPSMVWVLDAATDNTITTIPIDGAAGEAEGLAVTPDGKKVFVANGFLNTVTVIDTASNTVVDTIPVGRNPTAFGNFIGPVPAGSLASGDQCNGQFTGSFKGNIRVSAGQNCIFVHPCEIEGNVRVKGGILNLSCTVEGDITQDDGALVLGKKARVQKTVEIRQTSAFSLDPGSEIRGDLRIRDLVAGLPLGTICGIKVKGRMQIHGNASRIEIGANNANVCAGNIVGDNFQAVANSASLAIDNNKIGGSLQVNSNSGSTDVSGNSIGGDLRCQHNTSITSVAANIVAGKARGQCRVFPGMATQDDDGS